MYILQPASLQIFFNIEPNVFVPSGAFEYHEATVTFAFDFGLNHIHLHSLFSFGHKQFEAGYRGKVDFPARDTFVLLPGSHHHHLHDLWYAYHGV